MDTTRDNARIAYTLSSACGQKLDQALAPEGIEVSFSEKGLPEALIQTLKDSQPGQSFTLNLAAEEAYGPRDEELVTRVSKEQFAGIDNLQAGMQLEANVENEKELVWVREVGEETVVIDLNHPLAGVDLVFEVEVLA